MLQARDMTDVRDEKAPTPVEEIDQHKALGSDDASSKDSSDIHDAEAEKPVQHIPDDQYPRGLKLVLLAGASLVAVFLIALDQVSTLPQ